MEGGWVTLETKQKEPLEPTLNINGDIFCIVLNIQKNTMDLRNVV